jgi:hypothetical protein
VFSKGIIHLVLLERTFLHNEFGSKLNDALTAHFKVLYSSLTLKAECTKKILYILILQRIVTAYERK